MAGALFGAWDFLTRYATKDEMENFVLLYKRGKFVETLYGNFSDAFTKSPASMNQAVARKYAGYLSRRKFDFFCKIQKSTFDPENQKWYHKEIEYQGQRINLHEKTLSNAAVRKFVNECINIGDIHTIPGFCGVTRSVTALVTMIIDLHLRVPSLQEKLVWLNGIENHFVFEF